MTVTRPPAESFSAGAHRPILEAVRLRRAADDGTILLDDVSLAIQPGESVAIVGPPGAGKSLLLRALALLDPLDGGEVRFRGEPVPVEAIPEFRRRVIYVQQRPTVVEGTVRENMLLPFTLRAAGRETFDEQRIVTWLEAIGRERRFLDRPVADLSGGEMQIVSLLRALQLNPDVLLLDEPTSSLDDRTQTQIEALLREWMHSAGPLSQNAPRPTLVVITHDGAQAERMSNRQLQLERGRIVAD